MSAPSTPELAKFMEPLNPWPRKCKNVKIALRTSGKRAGGEKTQQGRSDFSGEAIKPEALAGSRGWVGEIPHPEEKQSSRPLGCSPFPGSFLLAENGVRAGAARGERIPGVKARRGSVTRKNSIINSNNNNNQEGTEKWPRGEAGTRPHAPPGSPRAPPGRDGTGKGTQAGARGTQPPSRPATPGAAAPAAPAARSPPSPRSLPALPAPAPAAAITQGRGCAAYPGPAGGRREGEGRRDREREGTKEREWEGGKGRGRGSGPAAGGRAVPAGPRPRRARAYSGVGCSGS